MKNRVVLLVDASPSIVSFKDEITTMVERTLETIQAAKPDSEVSLYIFDEGVKQIYTNVPATEVKRFTSAQYRIGSGTALYDAVKTGTEAIEIKDDKDYTYVVLALTDGEDNSSGFSIEKLRDFMQERQGTDRYTFAFMMPERYKANFLAKTGLPTGNVMTWDKIEEAEKATTAGLATYYTDLAAGKTSSKSFFEVNAAKITKKSLKQNLTNVAKNVEVYQIKKPTTPKAFLESKKIPFKKGILWYRLDKKEKVSKKKKVRIMVQGSPEVWDGPDAMSMVGFTPGVDSVVVPGNLGNKKVFVLSTSSNRKLYPGTEVIVDVR